MVIRQKNIRNFWLWALLPTLFGLLLVLLLAEFQLLEFHFSIHDIDTFILFTGLLTTVLISFILLSREGIRRIQLNSEHELRTAFREDRIRFLRRLDHEIKNPLMGIQTALDNLSHEQDPNKRLKISSAIHDQIDRLSRLIADLRRIGDMEHHEIEHLPVDTDMLLNDAFNMIVDEGQDSQRQLTLDLPDDLPRIMGDYDLLLLALHNILNNAMKYTNKDDEICLAAHKDDNCLQITVKDSGPGILPEDLPYVMDELYRSEQVKEIPGSGIGLALVKRIIKRHKGKITIESTPNRGTVVVICLPLESVS